ncbi:hypothetical protein B8A39_04435 [Dolosigranulum pigrum]|uniref:helix-turn-helix domain-containing protein n=1 Tax=Dolosigranulum pigrum TaxID=29394 RepID=UPI000DC00669|nr:XRE family transcriptional regulator [Dolosigranulum pigrum]RAN52405.1 hypothetical protein B8A39_04435 [Dolosigranulum pigrum]
MVNSVVLGKKIRKLRKEKGFTQEDVSGNGARLSRRHLSRIENGKVKPKRETIEYIAKQLDVTASELVNEQVTELPERYKLLRYKMLFEYTYGDEERIEERKILFDEIYGSFYDRLLEEEQLIIDTIFAKNNVLDTENIAFGAGLLKKYLKDITQKSIYKENDLVLIDLYLSCSVFEDSMGNSPQLQIIKATLLEQKIDNTVAYNKLFKKCILACIAQNLKYQYYDELYEYIELLEQLIHKTDDFKHRPLLDMFKAKHQIFHKNNLDKGKFFYKRAVTGAEYIGDTVMKTKIKQDMMNDID